MRVRATTVEKSGADSSIRQSSSGGRYAKEAIAVYPDGDTICMIG